MISISDGVPDASDQCPSVRGTVNGCPDTDSDGDGFPDRTDPCPAVSGMIDGCFTPPPPPSSEPAALPGAFRRKITLELGELGVTTRGLEVYSAPERATAGMVRPLRGKCSGSLKLRLDTAQGTASKTFRC